VIFAPRLAVAGSRHGMEARGLLHMSLRVVWVWLIVSWCIWSPAPSDQASAPAYVFTAGVNVGHPGDRIQLQAETRRSDGDSADVTADARWWTSDTMLASVSPTGLVTLRRPGTVRVFAAFGHEAFDVVLFVGSGSDRRLAEYEGTWVGELTTTWCRRLKGAGRNPCSAGFVHPVRLTLGWTRQHLSGTLEMLRNPARGPVWALISATGELVVGGVLRNESHGAVLQLREWRARLDGDTGLLSGHAIADDAFRNAFGAQLLGCRYELTGLSRSPSAG
jgi:hypothetical protein